MGLRILLQAAAGHQDQEEYNFNRGSPYVLFKTISLKASFPSLYFTYPSYLPLLDACYICWKRLLPEKDIYMYKGEAFCSEECRYRQIWMDEESEKRENWSLAAMKTTATTSSSPHYLRNKPNYITKNRARGFAY